MVFSTPILRSSMAELQRARDQLLEAGKLIAPQALLAFGQHLRHRAALKRLAQDHRDALANLR